MRRRVRAASALLGSIMGSMMIACSAAESPGVAATAGASRPATVAAATAGNTTVQNATDLRALLIAGRTPVRLEAVAADLGCPAEGCGAWVDGLVIWRDSGRITDTARRALLTVTRLPDRAPDVDWTPLDSQKVFAAGKRWGTCLEFTHTGLGKSGRFQRWTSVVLVPWADGKPGASAYRFVGYWTGCDSLTEGPVAGEVTLPQIEAPLPAEPNANITPRLVQHICTASACRTQADSRPVNFVQGSETGAMRVGG